MRGEGSGSGVAAGSHFSHYSIVHCVGARYLSLYNTN